MSDVYRETRDKIASVREKRLAELVAENAHLRAEIVRLRDPAQCAMWRTIETAPKDGTEIVGLFHRQYDESSPPTIYGPWTVAYDGRKWRSSWNGSEVVKYMSDFGTEYEEPDIDPTHWQPMPDASTIPSTDRGDKP